MEDAARGRESGRLEPTPVAGGTASGPSRLVDPDATAVLPGRVDLAEAPEDVLLAQHATLAAAIRNIFSELWQSNAFFTTFGSVALGAILTNWDKFLDAPDIATVAISVGMLYMMLVWFITTLKHRLYTDLHMEHARAIEKQVPGLSQYTRRLSVDSRLPSVRTLWLTVPIMFAGFILAVEVCRLAHVGV